GGGGWGGRGGYGGTEPVPHATPGKKTRVGARAGPAVATNASAKHGGRTYDVRAPSSADRAKRWLTPHPPATFLLRADVTWTPQPADIRDAAARRMHFWLGRASEGRLRFQRRRGRFDDARTPC